MGEDGVGGVGGVVGGGGGGGIAPQLRKLPGPTYHPRSKQPDVGFTQKPSFL